MPLAPSRRISLSLAAFTLFSVAACHTPLPNDLVLLEVKGASRFALSTEDGVVALAGDDLVGDLPCVQYWKGREIRDRLDLVQTTPDLALLKPETAKFTRSTFASSEIKPGEMLYVQLIADDFERLPFVIEGAWYEDGRYGDLFAVETWFVDEEDVAARFAGAGVYVKRLGVYEIVGILNGTLASNQDESLSTKMFGPSVLFPFVRLDQIAAVLPQSSNFFQRTTRTFRPDIEHGLKPDGSEGTRANSNTPKK